MQFFTRLSIVLFLTFSSAMLFAQNQYVQLKGVVTDPDQEPLTGATVVVLNPLDSALVSFAISDGAGRFVLNRVPVQPAVLQITYIGYGTFQQELELQADQTPVDVGEIWLSPENLMLQEVVVKSEHIPVLIKGDTIQYQADAFATRPDDNVENLLKKLPGVEVRRDGSIRAQGENVENVLVDGKPFFGNNAQVATRNLPADAVNAVQVYDKQSDLQEFSGIDDGEEEKTINLVLKEDKKAGQFGEATGGYGTDGRYVGRASINRFSGTTQMSLLGSANNTNEPGFSIMDYIDFVGGMERLMAQGGGRIQLTEDDIGIPLNFGDGGGLNTSKALGLNLNHDFGEKTQFSSNYFGSRLQRELRETYNRNNFLSDGAFESLGETAMDSRTDGHRLNLELKHEWDSRQRLQVRTGMGYRNGQTSRNQQLANGNTDGLLVNESDQRYAYSPNQWTINTSVQYFLKFKKAGRLFTASTRFDQQMDDAEEYILNRSRFLLAEPDLWSADSLDQQQLRDDQERVWSLGLTYTEPLAERWYWQNRLTVTQESDKRAKDFLDRNETNTYRLNTDLSGAFDRGFDNQLLRTGLLYTGQRSRVDLSVAAQRSILDGTSSFSGELPQRDFWHLLPRANWEFEMTDSKNLDLSYNTRITAPALNQLQTLVDNSNTLSLYQGNPDLVPEYRHDFSAGLMIIDAFSFTNFFANIRSSYIENRIVNSLSIDSLLRQLSSPVNTSYEWQNQLYASFSTPIRPLDIAIRLRGSASYTKGFVLVNEVNDQVDRWNQEWSFSFGNRKKEVVDWELGTTWNFSQATYDMQQNFNQNYSRQDWFAVATWFLPKDWVLSSEVEYQRFSNEAFGQQNSFALWQAALSKSLLQNNRLILKVSVFDLLNQNTGIQRRNAFNYFEESRSNALGRYAMLTATYKIGKVGNDE